MSPRYLLIVGDHCRARAELTALLSNRSGLTLGFENARFAALVNPACRCVSVGEAGCVLGWLFRRHGPAEQVSSLSADEVASVADSDGRALLSTFWGGYVAAIAGLDSVMVLRDPSGNFSCYFSNCRGLAFFASDAELLVMNDVATVDIDFEEIGRQLYRAFVPAPATALRGISELLAGFAVRAPTVLDKQEPYWSPWEHAEVRAWESEAAAERLSRVVKHCVQAWASTHRRLVLSVSGGLDSSIIAACLARRADTICLTMFTDDPSGDERMFARAVCDHLGLPLIERPYRLEDIDIAEPLAAHLPRPRDRTQANAHERVHYEVACEFDADAFMTGNGGDNIFGYSQSAAPIADRYLSQGLGPGMAASLLDVCRQTGCNLFDALGQAWRLARRAHQVRPNSLFLDPGFVAGLRPNEVHHPWLVAPAKALPGKAAHVATILRVQPNLESNHIEYPVLNPLVSQPIVEVCLETPTWEWRTGGRDRALARQAFARALPLAILNRRTKGTPSRFAARLLDHFRGPIRERLLGGRLSSLGIIDRVAIGQVLAGERPVPDLERVRILELVNVEAWVDHWTARAQATEQVKRISN